MEFEWDPGKADINRAKHGISFDEAASAFLDPMALSGPDPDHSANETRYVRIPVIVTVHSGLS